MRDRALQLLLHLHCLLLGFTAAISRQELFPYGAHRGDLLLPEGDDETSEVVKLAQPLLFYEAEFKELYVGTNGIISPQDFPRETQYVDDGFPTDFPVIAPFLSDIDTSNGRGKIYYRQDNSPEVLSNAARHIDKGFPQAAFSPTNVVLVTWENVGAYTEVTRQSDSSNRLNTFQTVLAYDESDSYAIFLYPEHGLQFFGTRPKESYNVHFDLPARVGFSRGESELLKREAPFHSVTNSEQSVKNLYQASNVGIPGVWVFHIGSISEIDNIIPAKVGNPHAQERYVPLINSHNDFPEHRELENHFNGENNYEDNYEDEDVDYPAGQTTELPTTNNAKANLDGSRGFLDIDDPTTLVSDLEVEQESLPYDPSNNPLPPSREDSSWYDRDGPLGEPQIQPSESRDLGNVPSYQTREEPSEPVLENGTPNPVDKQNSDLVYRSGRVFGYDEDGGFDTDVLTFNPMSRETCERKPGHCSQYAFCTDYSTGFCCHCQDSYYGNGIHCLPKGAPHRVNGKVSGNILVGQIPVSFDGIDLHAYIVVNDGRAYTAISQVPEPASWSLTPLTAIGGLFGWLFALEKPGHQNGFSVTGAKFVHNIEAVFSPGEEVIHITQVANGFDSDNYIHLRTTIKGKIPYIPETSTIQIAPYYEIYQYSGSVVTSTTYREYSVTSQTNEVQRFSYRLKQNITYQDCGHAQKFPPTAQKLSVDRVFALYNKDEKVLRFAITSHIGSVHDSTQEPAQVNPCYDGTHVCDTRAQCQPASGLNYTCVCAAGYQGDGSDCTDIDECDVGLASCGQNTQCMNLPGSYRCECLPGHVFSADGQNCISGGSFGNPCEDGTHTCNRATSQCVPRGDGVFTCECFTGYVRSGQNCIDVDECTQRRCHPDATCTNIPGSFSCQCNHGFTGDGFQCTQAPDERPQPKTCLEKRSSLLGETQPRGPRPGLFVPECDSEGNYAPRQCHASTGYCWCVNKDGEEIEGTRTPPGRAPPRCGAPDNQPKSTPCLEKRHGLLGGSHPRGARPIGAFVPECDEEGNYVPLQCHGSTGHCWCVDQNGGEIDGTRRPPGRGTPQCGIPEPTQRPQTMCERWKQSLLDHYSGSPSAEHYIPQCDIYGDFTPLQCHGNSGYCWCVDKDGREIEGSRTQPGMTPACLPSVAPPTMRPTPRPDVTPPASGTYLLYAQGQQIGYLPLDGTKLRKDRARTLLSLHGSIVVGIDYDCQEKKVYWTDVAGRTISRAGLEPGAEPEVVISTDLMSPEGLAIDYMRRTMFWTDSGTDKIESSRLDGSDRKTLFDTNLVNPRAITIDAVRGNLYWTDWNREAPKIETAFIDGSNRRILVNDNIGLPNGLTFDPFSKQICWADAGTKKLECILSNGSGRRVIQSNLNYPFSVVAYANHFYHTDWRRDGVISVNRETGQITEEYLPEQRSHLYGITAVYPYCPSGRK